MGLNMSRDNKNITLIISAIGVIVTLFGLIKYDTWRIFDKLEQKVEKADFLQDKIEAKEYIEKNFVQKQDAWMYKKTFDSLSGVYKFMIDTVSKSNHEYQKDVCGYNKEALKDMLRYRAILYEYCKTSSNPFTKQIGKELEKDTTINRLLRKYGLRLIRYKNKDTIQKTSMVKDSAVLKSIAFY